jgi:hypothetical protein
MLRNYILTAWRSIKKNKAFFTLNFIGLYISVVVCLLIGLMILHETSFDKSANNNLPIYRVVKTNISSTGKSDGPVTPYPLAVALRAAMPDEKLISQIHFQKDDAISFDNKKFKEQDIVFADSVFPQTVSFNRKKKAVSGELWQNRVSPFLQNQLHTDFLEMKIQLAAA